MCLEKLTLEQLEKVNGGGKSIELEPAEGHTMIVGGANGSPYMQEILREEEKRKEKNRQEISDRHNGYIK